MAYDIIGDIHGCSESLKALFVRGQNILDR